MSEGDDAKRQKVNDTEWTDGFDRARVESRRAYLDKRADDVVKLRKRQFQAEEEMFGAAGEMLNEEERRKMIIERKLYEEALRIKEQRDQDGTDTYVMPDVYDDEEE